MLQYGKKELLREQFDGGGGGNGNKDQSTWYMKNEGGCRERGDWYYTDKFRRKIKEIGERSLHFPSFNTDLFRDHYENTSIKKKLVFLRGIISHGKLSLQALLNQCDFLGGIITNDIEKTLGRIGVILQSPYIDEKELDGYILKIASKLDELNNLFYSNYPGINNPTVQKHIPLNLSELSNGDIEDYILDVRKKLHSLVGWNFISDKDKYAPGSIYMGRGITMM